MRKQIAKKSRAVRKPKRFDLERRMQKALSAMPGVQIVNAGVPERPTFEKAYQEMTAEQNSPLRQSHIVLAAHRAGHITALEKNERLTQEIMRVRAYAVQQAAILAIRQTFHDILYGSPGDHSFPTLGTSPVAELRKTIAEQKKTVEQSYPKAIIPHTTVSDAHVGDKQPRPTISNPALAAPYGAR